MSITFTLAQDAITRDAGKADQLGAPSTITVVDSGARVVAVIRQNGAPLMTLDVSLANARTSIYFGGATTADLALAIQPGAPLYGTGAAMVGPLAFLPGGFALAENSGAVVGAIGSCGGTPDQDALIAQAGATAA